MALDEDELIDLTMATISFLERRREAERRALDDAMP
uniref:Uncharacterized protein n=1 Tax=Candidatus Kentrum sp. TC TaxID=2126339 RepID=A0A450YW30_9GAMM|nr:MAG: hypothetical protein BECKTC1821E_GA0114239_105411 [Candidatus Kentron sp. TC]